jgi:hypothetical protein
MPKLEIEIEIETALFVIQRAVLWYGSDIHQIYKRAADARVTHTDYTVSLWIKVQHAYIHELQVEVERQAETGG